MYSHSSSLYTALKKHKVFLLAPQKRFQVTKVPILPVPELVAVILMRWDMKTILVTSVP